jgi:hypothetical protein
MGKETLQKPFGIQIRQRVYLPEKQEKQQLNHFKVSHLLGDD